VGVVCTPTTEQLVSTGTVRRRRRPPRSLLRAPRSCLGERFVSTRGTALGRPPKALYNLPRRRQRALLSQTLRSSFRIKGTASACFHWCHWWYVILSRRLKSSPAWWRRRQRQDVVGRRVGSRCSHYCRPRVPFASVWHLLPTCYSPCHSRKQRASPLFSPVHVLVFDCLTLSASGSLECPLVGLEEHNLGAVKGLS